MSTPNPLLALRHIVCRYGQKTIIPDLSLDLAPGQIACLLGPSGCGKTTALRAIAGFEPIHGGSISLAGQVLSQVGQSLPPERRQVGMVFQDYALFPHLSVHHNIAFGLPRQQKDSHHSIVEELLTLVRLPGYGDAYPHQLSGGQQQRVALARALAPNPRLLLMDEPFSNLDTTLRRSLALEVRSILKQRNISAILVTHDQSEAFAVADEIGVMLEGRIQQWDSPKSLFHQPSSQFVASFLGCGRFIPGQLGADRGSALTSLGSITTSNTSALAPQSPLNVLIRPWQLVHDPDSPWLARIVEQQFNGAASLTSLALENGPLVDSNDEALQRFEPGQEVSIRLHGDDFLAYPA